MSPAPINPPIPTAPRDLETRVANRQRELISEILEHKKNRFRGGALDAIDRIKDRLSDLAHILKEGVVDGWANVGPSATVKLDEWVAK
jgi:prephenate dehydrogenase